MSPAPKNIAQHLKDMGYVSINHLEDELTTYINIYKHRNLTYPNALILNTAAAESTCTVLNINGACSLNLGEPSEFGVLGLNQAQVSLTKLESATRVEVMNSEVSIGKISGENLNIDIENSTVHIPAIEALGPNHTVGIYLSQIDGPLYIESTHENSLTIEVSRYEDKNKSLIVKSSLYNFWGFDQNSPSALIFDSSCGVIELVHHPYGSGGTGDELVIRSLLDPTGCAYITFNEKVISFDELNNLLAKNDALSIAQLGIPNAEGYAHQPSEDQLITHLVIVKEITRRLLASFI